jgi:uncharacterized LabA/DUF88 family protein
MPKPKHNFAFIDSQNLNLAVHDCGWQLDFQRFRTYLKEKYDIERAYIFIGYLEGNQDLYASLQKQGYVLIFKPTLTSKEGKTKGNCDAELVLQAMIDLQEYEQAVIVSGDGDFHCLVKYLAKEQKLAKLLIPNQHRYSSLLKRFPSHYLAFVSDLRKKLEYRTQKKNPARTKP